PAVAGGPYVAACKLEHIAPRIPAEDLRLASNAPACCHLPLGLGRQTVSRPPRIGRGFVVANADHGVISEAHIVTAVHPVARTRLSGAILEVKQMSPDVLRPQLHFLVSASVDEKLVARVAHRMPRQQKCVRQYVLFFASGLVIDGLRNRGESLG